MFIYPGSGPGAGRGPGVDLGARGAGSAAYKQLNNCYNKQLKLLNGNLGLG